MSKRWAAVSSRLVCCWLFQFCEDVVGAGGGGGGSGADHTMVRTPPASPMITVGAGLGGGAAVLGSTARDWTGVWWPPPVWPFNLGCTVANQPPPSHTLCTISSLTLPVSPLPPIASPTTSPALSGLAALKKRKRKTLYQNVCYGLVSPEVKLFCRVVSSKLSITTECYVNKFIF